MMIGRTHRCFTIPAGSIVAAATLLSVAQPSISAEKKESPPAVSAAGHPAFDVSAIRVFKPGDLKPRPASARKPPPVVAVAPLSAAERRAVVTHVFGGGELTTADKTLDVQHGNLPGQAYLTFSEPELLDFVNDRVVVRQGKAMTISLDAAAGHIYLVDVTVDGGPPSDLVPVCNYFVKGPDGEQKIPCSRPIRNPGGREPTQHLLFGLEAIQAGWVTFTIHNDYSYIDWNRWVFHRATITSKPLDAGPRSKVGAGAPKPGPATPKVADIRIFKSGSSARPPAIPAVRIVPLNASEDEAARKKVFGHANPPKWRKTFDLQHAMVPGEASLAVLEPTYANFSDDSIVFPSGGGVGITLSAKADQSYLFEIAGLSACPVGQDCSGFVNGEQVSIINSTGGARLMFAFQASQTGEVEFYVATPGVTWGTPGNPDSWTFRGVTITANATSTGGVR